VWQWEEEEEEEQQREEGMKEGRLG